MLKVINAKLHKLGQSFLDEIEDVDWGDGVPDPRKRTPYVSKEDTPIPHGEQGSIDESSWEDYEPSKLEPREEGFLDEIPDEEDMFEIEPSEPPEGTNEIIYTGQSPYTMQQLVYDGIRNTEVITFEYIDRFNEYRGTRKVQPHYTFVAYTTGNEVLVSWDLKKQGIRAFIVGNIHPYGVRYEDWNFDPKGEIMGGVY